jgi:hypothetical protein
MPDAEFFVLANEGEGSIAEFWKHHLAGASIFIDECQLVYKARKWMSIMNDDPSLEPYFSQPRKFSDRIRVASHRWGDFPTFLRDRIQLCRKCYRLPGPLKVFLRWTWITEQGRFQKRVGFFPTIMPFSEVRKFGELYDTRGLVGKQSPRQMAQFKLPRQMPLPRWMITAGIMGGLAALGYWNKPSKSSPFSSLLSPASQPRVDGSPRISSTILPALRPGVTFKGGQYVPNTGGVVLRVEDDIVVVGSPDGRVLEFPRDLHAEYVAVRGQVASQGGSFFGSVAGDAERTGRGAGSPVRSNAADFLPGRGLRGRAAGVDPVADRLPGDALRRPVGS